MSFLPKDLKDLCIRLAKYKVENKELILSTFRFYDEITFIQNVKNLIEEQFSMMNIRNSSC